MTLLCSRGCRGFSSPLPLEELESGLLMPLVAVSAFERASRAKVLIAGDFRVEAKRTYEAFGLWNCVLR
ncbi:uncharacterized protein DS421_11g334770 [Arachis hypogaea]|nr:uncharacterized protein DS421_11g334770 [Arachis hypogaea]